MFVESQPGLSTETQRQEGTGSSASETTTQYSQDPCPPDGQSTRKHKSHRYEKKTEQERFWMKVRKSEPHECWPWIGAISPNGYGKFKKSDGTTVDHHRYALEQKLGRKLEKGEVARHRCDYRPCSNDAHLIPGTQLHNYRDMRERGRAVHWGRKVPPPPDSMRDKDDPEYCPF